MKYQSLQSLFAVLRPPEGQSHLSAYLKAASKALGGKPSDVGLARTIGVEPSNIANWKRRGSVPEDYIPWFTTTLIEKIGTYNSEIRDVDFLARKSVISFLTITEGNPLDVKEAPHDAAALALPALLCVAQFLCDALEAHGESSGSITAERIADLLAGSVFSLRNADQFRQFRR